MAGQSIGNFREPSAEMQAVYEKILALIAEGVWIPATGNGGLRQLLAEMEARGWKVIPPAIAQRPCACGQGTWGGECPQGSYCG